MCPCVCDMDACNSVKRVQQHIFDNCVCGLFVGLQMFCRRLTDVLQTRLHVPNVRLSECRSTLKFRSVAWCSSQYHENDYLFESSKKNGVCLITQVVFDGISLYHTFVNELDSFSIDACKCTRVRTV